ncbi:MAG: outer membrane protein [Gemmatimonadota bacterium]
MPTARLVAFPILLLSTVVPRAADAQSGYLFKPPTATLSFRIGAAGPSASDDLFAFFTEELTLERGDFRSFALAADLGIRTTSQLDLLLGVAYSGSSSRSEFRDWVDQDDQPIEQTTSLDRIPLTLSAKYYLVPRGRALSMHAWVPRTFTPYVTGGGGYTFYDLVQEGDFVDFRTLEVFPRRFESAGGGATAHVGAGGEWWLTPRLGLSLEGRYSWASADLDQDFSDFDRVDLRGFQITTGFAARF